MNLLYALLDGSLIFDLLGDFWVPEGRLGSSGCPFVLAPKVFPGSDAEKELLKFL